MLPEQYDPLLLDETSIELGSLIEDELTLALPIVPMHEPDECSFDPELIEVREQAVAAEQEPTAETRRPLAGLAEMLERRRDRD